MKKIVYIGNQLSKKGKTVTSVETLGGFLRSEGYQVITASSKSNKLLRLLDMLWTVISHRRNTDYVLIDTYSTQNFYYAVTVGFICYALGLKYIPILRGGNLPHRLKQSPKLSKFFFSRSSCNVCPSNYIYSKFKAHGFDKLKIIPNTIELDAYKVSFKKIEQPKLLWVRSLAKIYNPQMSLKVLYNLKKKGYRASLCMVGPDKEGILEELKSLSSKLEVQVDFTGKLSKEKWIELSKSYNIFINTTHFDNMPVSVIEAMALGFPVVSTNVGGVPFLIDHGLNGLLVDDNDDIQMADAIISLLENTDLAHNISLEARKKALQYDWKEVKKNWYDILK